MLYLSQTAAPAVQPVSLTEAKAHLRVDFDDDDTLISSLILAATAHFDGSAGMLGRALITQSWEYRINEFPTTRTGAIELPLAPLQSVESVKYIDSDGIEQTLATSVYNVRIPGALPGSILLKYAQDYQTTRVEDDAVRIAFTCGYGDAGSDVPMPIRQAILLWVGFLYASREPTEPELAAVDALVAPYVMRRV